MGVLFAPLVYDRPKQGHFRRDAAVVAAVVGGTALLAPLSEAYFRLFGHKGVLILQTADDYTLSFLAICLFRSVLGRRTLGILTRNRARSSPHWWKHKARMTLLSAIRSLPAVTTLHVIAPDGELPVDGDCLYAMQWWDLEVLPLQSIQTELTTVAVPTVIFLGNLGQQKGLSFFADVAQAAAARNAALRFVVVGDWQAVSDDDRAKLIAADVLSLPAPESEALFVSYIRQADWVWCCYHPASNKSSGIFGRALQLGRPSIVRKGSYLEPFQRRYGRGVSADYGDVDGLLNALLTPSKEAGSDSAERFGLYSKALLRRVCGLDSDGTSKI